MSSLIFVYNADSGLANALLDTGRRIFSPGKYPCSLCMVTYGPFGMKDDWKKFTSQLPYKVLFLHKNELPKKLRTMPLDFPCLLLQEPEVTQIIINREMFRKIKDLHTLQEMVVERLAAHTQLTH